VSEPIRRTGLESLVAAAGATDSASAGVVVRIGAGSGFINLRGSAAEPGFVASVEQALGQSLPVDANTLSAGAHRVYWLGPDEWLVVTAFDDASELCTALEDATEGGRAAVNDVSGGNVAIELSGPSSMDLLAKGCTIDFHASRFPTGACAQSGLAKAGILVGKLDASPRFELVVRRSFADYIVRWIMHSASPYGTDLRLA